MARYIYPAIFDPNELGGYTITFPDLPGCVTQGDTIDNALHMAAEAMALHLYGMEWYSEEVPVPSEPAHIPFPEDASDNAFVTLVAASAEPVLATRVLYEQGACSIMSNYPCVEMIFD